MRFELLVNAYQLYMALDHRHRQGIVDGVLRWPVYTVRFVLGWFSWFCMLGVLKRSDFGIKENFVKSHTGFGKIKEACMCSNPDGYHC